MQQNEPVRIEHVEQPNLYGDLMQSISRIIGGIALALVAATIISQLTKRREELPLVSDEVAVARVNWGGQLRSSEGARTTMEVKP